MKLRCDRPVERTRRRTLCALAISDQLAASTHRVTDRTRMPPCSNRRIGAEELFSAIVRKDEVAAQSLLAADAALAHLRDPHLGSTHLHFAAHRGLRSVVDALLAAGADPHAVEARAMR